MFGRCKRLCLATELLPLPVGSGLQLNNAAPSIQSHYRAFPSTTSCSAPVPRIGTLILAVFTARMSPFASGRQVLTFHTRAWSARAAYMPDCRSGGLQDSPRTDPGSRTAPPVLTSVYGISTLHQRFACARLSGFIPDGITSRLYCNAHYDRSGDLSCTGLRPAPDCRSRGACPHLLDSSTSPPS